MVVDGDLNKRVVETCDFISRVSASRLLFNAVSVIPNQSSVEVFISPNTGIDQQRLDLIRAKVLQTHYCEILTGPLLYTIKTEIVTQLRDTMTDAELAAFVKRTVEEETLVSTPAGSITDSPADPILDSPAVPKLDVRSLQKHDYVLFTAVNKHSGVKDQVYFRVTKPATMFNHVYLKKGGLGFYLDPDRDLTAANEFVIQPHFFVDKEVRLVVSFPPVSELPRHLRVIRWFNQLFSF